MARIRADLMLLFAAFIWGTAFVAQKTANETMGPVLFVGCRFLLSALLLAPMAWFERRRNPDPLPPGSWRLAGIIGVSLFGGLALQQIGMVTTTASNAGFITAIYVVMVPVAAWALSRATPRLSVAAGCALSLAGAWLLEGGVPLTQWNRGDLIILASDALQAVQITLVERFLARASRPLLLSFAQYTVIGILGLALGLATEPFDIGGIRQALPAILYAGLLSGGVAFTLQIVAQRHTPAAEAAIIMSLESVFAALAGAWLLGDRLGSTALAGCATILLAVIVVQLAPLLRSKKAEA